MKKFPNILKLGNVRIVVNFGEQQKTMWGKFSSLTSFDDYSISTSCRNYGGLLSPSNNLFKFGEWVVEQFINLLSLSYINLTSLPNMINSVNTKYNNNDDPSKKLQTCHPVAKYLIKRLGTRIVSIYCHRLSQTKKGFYNYIKTIL